MAIDVNTAPVKLRISWFIGVFRTREGTTVSLFLTRPYDQPSSRDKTAMGRVSLFSFSLCLSLSLAERKKVRTRGYQSKWFVGDQREPLVARRGNNLCSSVQIQQPIIVASGKLSQEWQNTRKTRKAERVESHVKRWKRGKSDEKRLIWTRDIDAFRVSLSRENKGLASFVVDPKPLVDDVCLRIICFPNYRRSNRITMRGILKFVVRGICGSFILDRRQFFRKIDRAKNFYLYLKDLMFKSYGMKR